MMANLKKKKKKNLQFPLYTKTVAASSSWWKPMQSIYLFLFPPLAEPWPPLSAEPDALDLLAGVFLAFDFSPVFKLSCTWIPEQYKEKN